MDRECVGLLTRRTEKQKPGAKTAACGASFAGKCERAKIQPGFGMPHAATPPLSPDIRCGGEHPPDFIVLGKISSDASPAPAWEGCPATEAALVSIGTATTDTSQHHISSSLRTNNVYNFGIYELCPPPPPPSEPAERTSTQVTHRANRKKRLTVLT